MTTPRTREALRLAILAHDEEYGRSYPDPLAWWAAEAQALLRETAALLASLDVRPEQQEDEDFTRGGTTGDSSSSRTASKGEGL